MYWNRRKTDNDYVVIKHPLRNSTNTYFQGLKFARGYAVVVKESKSYFLVKKAPFLRNHQEFELAHLKEVFRLREIELIFGKDVYLHYLDAIGLGIDGKPIEKTEDKTQEIEIPEEIETKVPEEEPQPVEVIAEPEPVPEVEVEEKVVLDDLTEEQKAAAFKNMGLCHYIKKNGEACGNKAIKSSPAGYCFGHVRFDPDVKRKK